MFSDDTFLGTPGAAMTVVRTHRGRHSFTIDSTRICSRLLNLSYARTAERYLLAVQDNAWRTGIIFRLVHGSYHLYDPYERDSVRTLHGRARLKAHRGMLT